jgi:hypothetical protein
VAEPTFWQAAWAWIKRVFRWVAAPLPAILLVIGAILLAVFIGKNIPIGGLLAKLFGTDPKKGKKAIDVANSVPEDRVDKDGVIIKPGEPDSKGQTQAVVVPIEETGIFDNPDKVTIYPPGEDKPVVVDLPDGVKAKDVDKVIVVQPEVYAVTVKDSSEVKAKDIDDLLEKYGS